MKKLFIILFTFLLLSANYLHATPPPPSYGKASQVDTPIIRIPFVKKVPRIDGIMEEGEWEDSTGISGFWYDYGLNDFRYMAPLQTQLQVYACYDKENLYLCYTSPVYPKNSWLRAKARFPDVLFHPMYGVLWDDHIEFELRPWDDMKTGFMMGLYKWTANPNGTVCDQYWSPDQGRGRSWSSQLNIRTKFDADRWIVEMAIPLKTLKHGKYAGKHKDGSEIVDLPIADGTTYRCWFTRGVSGNGAFFNVFDKHCWNTTKTQLVFDSKAPSFQLNELGPLMEDQVKVDLTVKNHNEKSQTVRIGFFVENQNENIYSSYDDPELKGGLLELRPGEVRKITLMKTFPGISKNGNVLWFDVRAAGSPAKSLFRTRLISFHSMEGGESYSKSGKKISFRERRIDNIEKLRPPKRDFDTFIDFSPIKKRLSLIVDKGLKGASDEAKRAVEAKLTIYDANDNIFKELLLPFNGSFATTIVDMSDMAEGEKYFISMLMFDKNKRVVGEYERSAPLVYIHEKWINNQKGLDDVVWEPYSPIKATDSDFETLKHRFQLTAAGLPKQIFIKPDPREIPLTKRHDKSPLTATELAMIGRGDQLKSPFKLIAIVDGKPVEGKVIQPAKLIRKWKSEVEYQSTLQFAQMPVTVTTRYDCDGSMHCNINYGSKTSGRIDRFEMVAGIKGLTDTMAIAYERGGMTGTDHWNCTLPMTEGIVMDSAKLDRAELYYNHFVPWIWFGSGDRGFAYYNQSCEGMVLDLDGTNMTLERDKQGEIIWRTVFVNHPVEIDKSRTIKFTVLTFPTKPKPKDFRTTAWHYMMGSSWCEGYMNEPIELSESYLKQRWQTAAQAPKGTPYEKAADWKIPGPPYHRYGRWRNVGVTAKMNQEWEQKGIYYLEEQVRIGRRVGWWWDEYFPVCFGRSENLAAGDAHLRDPKDVKDGQLPWHAGYIMDYMRNIFKRLARIHATNNVPARSHTWANGAATLIAPFIYDCMLIEECGSYHRSFEVDALAQFPNSLITYESHNWTGLPTRVAVGPPMNSAGDDKRLGRQYLGRAMLHDHGVLPFRGAEMKIENREQPMRLMNRLIDFGYFDDQQTEFIPFWRNQDIVTLGKAKPLDNVYCSVYKRPLKNGKGYKAIVVILNQRDSDIEEVLNINEKKLLGSGNSLTEKAVMQNNPNIDKELKEWWAEIAKESTGNPVITNFETGEIITQSDQKGKYGPIYVPYHDYRVLYLECNN